MEHEPNKSTTAIVRGSVGAMKHLARFLKPIALPLATAVLVWSGMDHDDAHALVHVGHPIVSAVWRRWRRRRRSVE